MSIGIFLAIGESWADFIAKGQDKLFIEERLMSYKNAFKQVYVFSYGCESGEIIPGVNLIGNKYRLHRYIYAFLMPIIYCKLVNKLSLIRGMQLSGGIPGIIAKILYRKKVIINYGYEYAYVSKSEGQRFRSWLYSIIERLLIPLFDAVIVTTPFLYAKIKLQQKKTYLIPNSIDTNLFKPLAKRNNLKIILFVGRLEKQKNLFLLIDAVSKIVQKKLQLLFIGTGSLKEKLLIYAQKKQVKLEIIESVKNEDLFKYYNQATMFVLPSLIEGHPKVLLEAMSCGTPVIGNNVDGIKDMIENRIDGILFENTGDSLRQAIINLLEDPKLFTALGRHARLKIMKLFDRRFLNSKEITLIRRMINEV